MKIQPSIAYPSAVKLVTRGGFQIGFIVVTLFLTLYYNAAYYWYTPLTGVDWDYVDDSRSALQITQVLPGSPGEAGGLQEGDRLLTIDGQAVVSLNRPFYTHKNAGDVVYYTVERGGQQRSFEVIAGDYGQYPEYLLAMLPFDLLSLAVYALGLLLCLLSAPQDTRARLVGAAWLLVGLAVAAGMPGYASGGWFAVDVFLVTFAVGGYLSLAAYLYFPAAVFSNRTRLLILRAHLLLTLLALAAYAWQRISTVSVSEAAPPQALVSGALIRYIFILTWLVNLVLLLKNGIATQENETKRQARIILLGTLLGVLPVLLFSALPGLLLGQQFVILPGQVTVFALVFIPLFYGYVIGQRKLLKIDWLFNRALALFILVALALLASAGVVGLLSWLHGSAQALQFGSVLCVVLLTVGLHRRIQVWVDHVLYNASYDFRSVTTNLSRQLLQVTDRRNLDDTLVEFVKQMHIQKSALLLAREGSLELRAERGREILSPIAEDEICQFLLESGRPARAANVWDEAGPHTPGYWAVFNWARVLAPVVYNGALHGVLLLGDRLNGDYYSDQDMENIHTVSRLLALALANLSTVESLRGLSQRLVQTDENHRRSLARELHDNVLQRASRLRTHAASLNPEDLTARLDELVTSLRQTIDSERTSLMDSGIVAALQDLVDDLEQPAREQHTSLRLRNLLPEKSIALDDEKNTALYRIAQEALSNALKHAQASDVVVALKMDADTLEIEIKDNGIGMADAQYEPPGHYGLLGMRERAAMIGATLSIISAPDDGTAVRVRLKP